MKTTMMRIMLLVQTFASLRNAVKLLMKQEDHHKSLLHTEKYKFKSFIQIIISSTNSRIDSL